MTGGGSHPARLLDTGGPALTRHVRLSLPTPALSPDAGERGNLLGRLLRFPGRLAFALGLVPRFGEFVEVVVLAVVVERRT